VTYVRVMQTQQNTRATCTSNRSRILEKASQVENLRNQPSHTDQLVSYMAKTQQIAYPYIAEY